MSNHIHTASMAMPVAGALAGPYTAEYRVGVKKIAGFPIYQLIYLPGDMVSERRIATLTHGVEAAAVCDLLNSLSRPVNEVNAALLAAAKPALEILDKQREEYNSAPTILPREAAEEGPIAKALRAAIKAAEESK